ncbi:diphthamide biosynthesis protein 3 [Cryptococcus sp. DSM 104549]
MPNYYDELEIEDFAWDPVAKLFHYPCPCGDRFEISKGQLRDGEEIAICPSCSLIVRVIYDYLDWEDYTTTDDEDDAESVDTPLTDASHEPQQEAPKKEQGGDEDPLRHQDEQGDEPPLHEQVANLALQDSPGQTVKPDDGGEGDGPRETGGDEVRNPVAKSAAEQK